MKQLFSLMISVLAIFCLPNCNQGAGNQFGGRTNQMDMNERREMNGRIKGMDTKERKMNQAASKQLVAFMSLDVMFPDPSVRALAKAAGSGDIKKIDQLVKEGVNVNSKGTQGATPLFWALHDYNGFKHLLELGADPNVVFGDRGSVMGAILYVKKDERFLNVLLKHGGNANVVLASGEPALFPAVFLGVQAVDDLVAAGADINSKNRNGFSLVMYAAMMSQFDVVYDLLERGADYTVKSSNGRDLAFFVSLGRRGVNLGLGAFSNPGQQRPWVPKVVEWLRARGIEVSDKPVW